jgi:ribosomal protein RSM22 (predicted rRNA methylase)
MSEQVPRPPSHLSGYGEICLQALADAGLGDKISLGGALGLLYYYDYRPTYDVDAWWVDATEQGRQRVIRTITKALEPLGAVTVRSWGDVVSIELKDDTGKVFSFQIAQRSAQLEPAKLVPELGVLLDSFPDLIASKMVALVERGLPRDFRDIHAVCQAGLITPQKCWDLWRRRQQIAGSDTDHHRAKLAIETHLERIAQHRQLDEIADPEKRREAHELRKWFREVFLNAAE